MSMDSTKELIFQNEMIAQMEARGWICGKTDGYDRERALYSQDALAFVQTTQPQEWKKFAKIYPTDTERHFLDALVAFLIDFIITLSDFGKRFGHVLLRKSEQESGCGIAGRCVLELGNQEVPADNGFLLGR